jgi:DNA repair protein SbcD/Mre11
VRLVHLADLHLGHRSFQGGRTGKNPREADVAAAFQSALEEVIRLEPEAILIAGDVFDRPEPPHSAVVTLAQGLESIRGALPRARVCMLAGSRDTPADPQDPGVLTTLDTLPGVEAVTSEVRSVIVPESDLHVLMVPHRAAVAGSTPELRPIAELRWNVLLGYGRVVGREEGALPIREDDWDYIALGHEHVRRQVRPRAFYAGSLERVGPAPWTEAGVEKGFLCYDLEERRASFRAVVGRPVVSLAPIRYERDRPARLSERVGEVLQEVPGGIDGKIVRLRLQGVPVEEIERIRQILREYRRRALHLEVQLEEVGPDRESDGRRQELAGRVARRLETDSEDLADLTRLVEDYLQDPHFVSGGMT